MLTFITYDTFSDILKLNLRLFCIQVLILKYGHPDPIQDSQINADPRGSGSTTLLAPTDLADAVGGGADPHQGGEFLLPSRRFLSQTKLLKNYK